MNSKPQRELTVLPSTNLAELCGGHYSHDEVAAKVRMLMRHDLDHEVVCTMARDRIKWLAHRVTQLESEIRDTAYPQGISVLPTDLSLLTDFAATRPLEPFAVVNKGLLSVSAIPEDRLQPLPEGSTYVFTEDVVYQALEARDLRTQKLGELVMSLEVARVKAVRQLVGLGAPPVLAKTSTSMSETRH